MWGKIMNPMKRLWLHSLYQLYGPHVHCRRQAVKFNHSLTASAVLFGDDISSVLWWCSLDVIFSMTGGCPVITAKTPKKQTTKKTTFRCILLKENVWILIEISLKSVPWGQIDNNPVLVLIMAWPLSEPMMVSFTDAYMPHLASAS